MQIVNVSQRFFNRRKLILRQDYELPLAILCDDLWVQFNHTSSKSKHPFDAARDRLHFITFYFE